MNTLRKIKEVVEIFTGVGDLASPNRSTQHAIARAMYYTLARSKTSCSLQAIAEVVNKKTHCSALKGMRCLPQYLKHFPQYVEVYRELEEVNYNLSSGDIRTQREKLQQLNRRVTQLTRELQSLERVSLPESHIPLLHLVSQIPTQHVDNVVMRLQPIIKMLPKTYTRNG